MDSDMRSFLSDAYVLDHLQDTNFSFYRFVNLTGFCLLAYDSIVGTGHVHQMPASSPAEEVKPLYAWHLSGPWLR